MAAPPRQIQLPAKLPDIDPRVSGKVSRYVVNPSTAAKFALASFAIGVFVGFRLSKTIRRIARSLLTKIQKD